MSFERALRAESNDTKIMWGSKWYGLEMVKTSRMVKMIKNHEYDQNVCHLKELDELSRMAQKSA